MVNFEFFDSFYDDSVTKQITVTATGINIDSSQINVESLFLEEKLNTQNDLTFGQCNPHGVEMDIFSECPNLIGVTVTVTVILSDHPEEPFVIGNYKVYEDTLDEDTDLRHIVAWDALSEINNADITQWWNDLAFPMTVKDLRDSFFQQFGITQEQKTLINDSILIPRTTYGELSGIEVLSDILSLNAVSGFIGRDGYFKYIDYADPDEVDIEESQYQNIEIETFMTDAIDKVQIRSSGSDIGAIVGDGSNAYILEDNMLLYGKTAAELETIATNIFDKISSISYYPCEIDMVGNPCIECGDLLHISVNGIEKNTFVMNRDLYGIQEMLDDVQTPGQRTRSEQVYSVNKELHKMRGKSFYIEKTVEGLKLEVENISEDYVDRTTFEQSSTEVQLQIESLQSQIDGELQYWETTETPTLLNYPYWDFCTNIPCNNTVQTTNDLKFVYTEDDRRNHLRDLCFDTVNLISYRFVKENDAWGWQEIADTETNVILQRISQLEITSAGLQTDVGQISYELDNNIYTKAETDSQISQTATQIQSTVSANYATKTTTNQMQSQITQQAGLIDLKVSKGSISSEISQELGQITITGDRLVVNASNFALTREGDLYTKDSFSMSNMITGERKTVIGFERTGTRRWVAAVDYDYRPQTQLWGHTPGHYETEYHAYLNSCLGNELIYEKCQYWDGFDGSQWTMNGVVRPSTPFFENEGTFIPYSITCEDNLTVKGNLQVLGAKLRSVKTEHYGIIGQNAYETCEPYFGDIGESVIEEDGKVFVPIEEIFNETVSIERGYQVFLQKYGAGDCYVAERNNDGFIVKGTPGISFGWEIKARQKGYEDIRLQKVEV